MKGLIGPIYILWNQHDSELHKKSWWETLLAQDKEEV
jgi:hypothetical protein